MSGPFRKVVRHEGPPRGMMYVDEVLECGHYGNTVHQTDAENRPAKKRRCVGCVPVTADDSPRPEPCGECERR